LGPKSCWRKALILRLAAAAKPRAFASESGRRKNRYEGKKNPAAARKYDAGSVLNECSFSQEISDVGGSLLSKPYPMAMQAHFGDPSGYIVLLWIVWLAIWLVASIKVKKVRAHEPVSTRIAYLIPKVLTALLLFSPIFRRGVLNQRFIPHSVALDWTGVAVAALGIAITFWARVHIGRNWSARVVIKEQHELIRSGPYRFVRHPIYTGLLIAIVGTALVIGEWRAVLAMVFAVIGFTAKAKREEAILVGEFGEDYARYRGETGMLLPRLH
jgi:protein-S-isoprenylcysteine O-methyltransferase Ste14